MFNRFVYGFNTFVCLLHDIGYPSQQDLGFQKSNHTIEGMRLIKDLLEDKMKKLFFSLGLADALLSCIGSLLCLIILILYG